MTADAKAARPQVYLIANPMVRKLKAWGNIRGAVKARTKNAKLHEFSDLFTGQADYAAHWPERLGQLDGAIVIPARRQGSLWLGKAAEREADHLAQLGKPVLVLGPAGLLPWPQVKAKLDQPEAHPRGLPLRVVTDEYRSSP